MFVNCTVRALDGDGVEGGTFSKGGPAFKPPYEYSLDPADTLEAAVKAGAGPTLKPFLISNQRWRWGEPQGLTHIAVFYGGKSSGCPMV